jgi:anthranilate/para-aminobenzoate synthase component I
VDGGQVVSRWVDFSESVAALWSERSVRDDEPWAVGWLGYEACAEIGGGLPTRDDATGMPSGVLLVEPRRCACEPTEPLRSISGASPRWSLDDARFRACVQEIRERIEAGDVYQVSLSRRLTVDRFAGTMDDLLAASCIGGIPIYLARMRFGWGELLTASMELLLRRRGSELETRPIKGTRRRGSSEVRDRELVAELDGDPKERAELAMIVDLERNDFGRVCEAGSVRVVDPGSVHTFPTVHHRIARVTGRLDPSLEWWDALAAIVPGGSVTGCPKIAAMAVIAELESVPRGPYTGALGVISGAGDLEMTLPIRSAWSVGETLELAAGCGIVWESVPESEELESRIKIARWLELLEGVG